MVFCIKNRGINSTVSDKINLTKKLREKVFHNDAT